MRKLVYSNYVVWLLCQWLVAPIVLVIVSGFVVLAAVLEAFWSELKWMAEEAKTVELGFKYSTYLERKREM